MSMNYYLQSSTATRPLFRKASKLHIDQPKDWPLASLDSLSSIVDLSQLVEIKLRSNFFGNYKMKILSDMAAFIHRTNNISLLIIDTSSYRFRSSLIVENICLMVPSHVKYLNVSVRHFQDMKIILERCQHLSCVQFSIQCSRFSPKIVQWLANNTIYSTYREDARKLTVWLGRFKIESNELNVNHKRIKLTDKYHKPWIVGFADTRILASIKIFDSGEKDVWFISAYRITK
jgi:hypothetical protein